MAKTSNRFDTVEDGAQYDVRLLRPIKVGRTWLRPGEPVRLKGHVIKTHAEDIEHAAPVPA